MDNAQILLNHDFGRTKTGYFMGGNIKDAFSEDTASGRYIGHVKKVDGNKIFLEVDVELKKGFRIRIQKPGTDDRFNLKVKEVGQEHSLQYLTFEKGNPAIGDNIFLTEIKEKKFPSKFNELPSKRIPPLKFGYLKKIQGSILSKHSGIKKTEVFVRINSMAWLKKIHLNEVDFIILSFSKQSWKSFNVDAPFIQKFRDKIIIELPRFIPEKSIDYYQNILSNFLNKGICNVMLSHLSQKLIVPQSCKIHTNENTYLFNDAAIQMIKQENIENYTYPLENDIENLQRGSDRNGIVPLYFYPELFFSRMPVNIDNKGELQNDEKGIFQRVRKNGMTSVVPIQPVSLLQYKKKLAGIGFYRFLIDVSHDKPSKNLVKKLINRLHYSEQVQPSTTFNFKRELK